VVAQTFRLREGLNAKPQRAPEFYGVIAAGILVGIAMNLFHIDAIKALFWSAVLNGVAAVPLIVVIVLIASDSNVMGEWRSSRLATLWGWATATFMGAATLAMFYFSMRRS
jgi:Mn2+/Fe2+ NRAMP family transporter